MNFKLNPPKIRAVKRIRIVVSTSRSGLLKSCKSFLIERSEIRKKHDFKSVHFECGILG